MGSGLVTVVLVSGQLRTIRIAPKKAMTCQTEILRGVARPLGWIWNRTHRWSVEQVGKQDTAGLKLIASWDRIVVTSVNGRRAVPELF